MPVKNMNTSAERNQMMHTISQKELSRKIDATTDVLMFRTLCVTVLESVRTSTIVFTSSPATREKVNLLL